jgi:hypothetical protein
VPHSLSEGLVDFEGNDFLFSRGGHNSAPRVFG